LYIGSTAGSDVDNAWKEEKKNRGREGEKREGKKKEDEPFISS